MSEATKTRTLTVTIDGTKVEVPPGTTLYDAAAQAGIDIPVLCHAPGLQPVAVCRVCAQLRLLIVTQDGHQDVVVVGLRVHKQPFGNREPQRESREERELPHAKLKGLTDHRRRSR